MRLAFLDGVPADDLLERGHRGLAAGQAIDVATAPLGKHLQIGLQGVHRAHQGHHRVRRERRHRLAETTQDTIYLSERSGLEAVCTNRALGDYPIKAIPLDIGIRRPLGVGAGGLAMLCAMPLQEAEAIIESNGHRYEKFASFSVDYLREAVERGRSEGYSFLDSVVTPGTAAIGLAFPAVNPVGRSASQRSRADSIPCAARTWCAS